MPSLPAGCDAWHGMQKLRTAPLDAMDDVAAVASIALQQVIWKGKLLYMTRKSL